VRFGLSKGCATHMTNMTRLHGPVNPGHLYRGSSMQRTWRGPTLRSG
jgi:hypothetical protein